MKVTITLFVAIMSTFVFANTSVINLGRVQNDVASVTGSAKPVYYDIDRDGKKDLIVGNSAGKVIIYKNTGTTATPVFDISVFATIEDGTEIDVGSISLPAATDWNGDGLPDLIIGTYKEVHLYTNITVTTGVIPNFADAGLLPALDGSTNIPYVYGKSYLSANIVSYDGTSSNDLLVGDHSSSSHIRYYKNIGSFSSPVLTNMGNIKDAGGSDLTFTFGPSAIMFDWNSDGTNELIVSDMTSINVFYTTNYPPVWIPQSTFELTPEMLYYKLDSCGDINNDGLNDLLAGDFIGGLYWVDNKGTAENASFSSYNSVEATKTNVTFDTSNYSLSIWDFNGDGLSDISLRRSSSSGMRMYANKGTVDAPSFTYFEPAKYSYNAYDRFYTFNSNQFRYTLRNYACIYTNTGSYSSPYFSVQQYLMEGTDEISYVNNHSGFDVADLNGDGKLDLWYIFYGTNYWFENTNDNFTPIYKQREIAVDNVGSNMIFNTTYKYVPKIYDWNGDGKFDLIVAERGGNIHYYRNISNYPPVFVDEGLFEIAGEGEVDFGDFPYGFGIEDIDNNGFANLFIGFNDGTTREYEATPEPGLFLVYCLSFMIYYVRKKI